MKGRWLVLAVVAGLLVCASAPLLGYASEPSEEVAGQGVALVPSVGSERSHETDTDSGRVMVSAGTIDFLIRVAYDVHPRELVYKLPIDRRARYDLVATPPDGQIATANAMIRDKLEASFGFYTSRDKRLVEVNILQRIDGVLLLSQSTSPEREVVQRRGRFSGTRIRMDDLVTFTRDRLPTPIVDETGLDGEYDLVMQWDPSASGNALIQSFEDLGLEFVKGRRLVDHLVISRARAPRSKLSDE